MSHFADLRLLRQELADYDARLKDDGESELTPLQRQRLEGLRRGVLRLIEHKLTIIHARP